MIEILKKINYLFKLLIKGRISINYINKCDILIYDTIHASRLRELFKNYKTDVLYVRGERFHIFPLVLSFFSKKNKMNSYIENYIRLSNPRLMITFCDNDERFSLLKNKFNNLITIFIQNGWRSNYLDIFENLENKNILNKNDFNVDYMFVYGKAIGKEYSKYISGEIKVLGSYINNSAKIITKKSQNTISFISHYDPTLEEQIYSLKGNKKSFYEFFYMTDKFILEFLKEFSKKYNKNLLIIPRTKKQNTLARAKEIKYFHSILKSNVNLLDIDDQYPSYSALDYSTVNVNIDSTLGYESLARGNKTVFFSIRGKMCDVEDLNNFGWPGKFHNTGEFWTNIPNKKKFEKILDYVCNISNKRWQTIQKQNHIEQLIKLGNNKKILKTVEQKIF